jgi:CRISPR-associated endonuclease/helicase Cas3
MINDEDLLLQFWGKTPKPGDPPDRYHPAIFHMLDVAFVAEALLRDGAPRLHRALLHAWDGCDPDALVAWLPFLIATHDLGKISAAFQGQASNPGSKEQRKRLEQGNVRFPAVNSKDLPHATISAVWLYNHLERREPALPPQARRALCDAMGGHHGRFTDTALRTLSACVQLYESREYQQWETWRDATYTLLRHQLLSDESPAMFSAPHRLRPATIALTGFIIVSDWIGSNSDYFPASADIATDAYMPLSRERAQAGLIDAGLWDTRPTATYPGFSALFPENPTPRPLQETIEQLPADLLSAPLLVVIEAPTGEGKTEAAQALAQRLGAGVGQVELFFALPTMATSNQMFMRLETFFQRLYGQSVKLTHSQAGVVEDELRQVLALANDIDAADQDGQSRANALRWFASSKKALLAPFGVGTVDQVELGGLNVRHYMLRLFALACKVVVVDEVHAYDTYMSTILEHTLCWLASLGTSVILLSATLPTERHRSLARSYLQGLGLNSPQPNVPAALDYPAVSVYHAGGQERFTPTPFRMTQSFALRLTSRQDAAAEAARLIDLVRDGGAVARICNRVDDAQDIYDALRALVVSEQRILIHARFPLNDRQALEQQIDAMVGKRTVRRADQPLIIVGTQMLEQSLDYDVDVMVSDFAPIDLLLQRAGRLHRHAREARPERHAQPLLIVTLLLNAEGLPEWGRWKAIYEPYVLWRSWEVLHALAHDDACDIALPRDYRALIEAVYGPAPVPPADAPYAAQIAAAFQQLQRQRSEHAALARKQLTPAPTRHDPITVTSGLSFVEDEDGQLSGWQVAKTRLGDRISVVPIYRVDGELHLHPSKGWPVPISSPSFDDQRGMLRRVVPLSDPAIIKLYRDEGRRELHWPWGEPPALLRYIYPLYLDPSGRAQLDNRRVYLDKELGLVIEKEQL